MENLQEMIVGMINGDSAAIEDFYDIYMPKVYRIALRWMGNHQDAEDISHDLFLEALMNISKYDPTRGSLDTWLAIRTRSRCIDLLRKQQRTQFTLFDPKQAEMHLQKTSSEKPVEEKVIRLLQKDRLIDALSRIPELQSQAIKAVYYEEKTQREASAMMAKPLGTLKSLVRYGVKNLRKQLTQEMQETTMIS